MQTIGFVLAATLFDVSACVVIFWNRYLLTASGIAKVLE